MYFFSKDFVLNCPVVKASCLTNFVSFKILPYLSYVKHFFKSICLVYNDKKIKLCITYKKNVAFVKKENKINT